jgi:hypothetical protein
MNPAMEQLQPLVGEWSMAAAPPDGPPWPGGGRVSFEWLEDGNFLLERWSVEMPEAPDGVAIIGCDATNGTYFQLYSDVRGVNRVYEMSFADGEWRMWRDGDDPFPQRFVARLSQDGKTFEGRWEKASDGANWETDFNLTYTKVS